MTMRSRRHRGAAAVSLLSVTFLPAASYAATGDVDVTITNHTAQDAVDGPNVSVETSFTSLTGRNVTRVEFFVDGQLVANQKLEQPQRKGNFIFAWDTTSLSNDIHTVEAKAYDDQGKAGETKLQLFVDNQAIDQAMPKLRVTAPREGAVVSGQFWVQVDAQSHSQLQPVSLLSIKLDDDLIGALDLDGGSNVKMLFDGSTLPDGPHMIQAASMSDSGARVLSPPIIVIVNNAHGQTNANPGAPPTEAPGDTNLIPGTVVAGNDPGALLAPPAPDSGISSATMTQARGALNPETASSAPRASDRIPPSLPTHHTAPHSGASKISTRPHIEPVSPAFGAGKATHSTARPSEPAHRIVSTPTSQHRPSIPPIAIALAPTASSVTVQRYEGWSAPQTLSPSEAVMPQTGVPGLRQLQVAGPQAPSTGVSAQQAVLSPEQVVTPGAPTSILVVRTNEPAPHAQGGVKSTTQISKPAGAPAISSVSPQIAARPASPAVGAPDATFFLPIPMVLEPAVPTAKHTHIAMRPKPTAEEINHVRMLAHQPNTPRWLRVAYDNKWMNFDVPPTIVHGIPTMPFRALFEQSGGIVDWDGRTHTVTAEKAGKSVRLQIGSRTAQVNHQVVQLLMPAFIKKGRTMVPLGFVREAMDVNVQFNPKTGEVILTSKKVLAMLVR